MVSVFGVGEAPFSISSGNIEISVRKTGNVTNALFNLKEGDEVGIRGPYGEGYPVEEFEDKDIYLISGGCGLAPIRALIERINQNRKDFGKITLIYGAKTPSDILYKREISKWKKKFDVRLTVDKPTEKWKYDVGVVTKILEKIKITKKSVFCICGPEIMMKFAVDTLLKKGVNEDYIFLSLERKMQCGVGICCHCNIGNLYVCRDGPVFRYSDIKEW